MELLTFIGPSPVRLGGRPKLSDSAPPSLTRSVLLKLTSSGDRRLIMSAVRLAQRLQAKGHFCSGRSFSFGKPE